MYKIKYILTEFNCNNSIILKIRNDDLYLHQHVSCRDENFPEKMWVWLVISNPFLNLRIPIGWECHAEQTKPSGSVTERRNCFLCSCMRLFIFVQLYVTEKGWYYRWNLCSGWFYVQCKVIKDIEGGVYFVLESSPDSSIGWCRRSLTLDAWFIRNLQLRRRNGIHPGGVPHAARLT